MCSLFLRLLLLHIYRQLQWARGLSVNHSWLWSAWTQPVLDIHVIYYGRLCWLQLFTLLWSVCSVLRTQSHVVFVSTSIPRSVDKLDDDQWSYQTFKWIVPGVIVRMWHLPNIFEQHIIKRLFTVVVSHEAKRVCLVYCTEWWLRTLQDCACFRRTRSARRRDKCTASTSGRTSRWRCAWWPSCWLCCSLSFSSSSSPPASCRPSLATTTMTPTAAHMTRQQREALLAACRTALHQQLRRGCEHSVCAKIQKVQATSPVTRLLLYVVRLLNVCSDVVGLYCKMHL